MKKYCWILLALLLLTGCELTESTLGASNIEEYIQPPPVQSPKISGTWKWTDSLYLGEGEVPATEEPGETSRYILITEDFTAAFRQYTTRPSLRSKVVNATNYVIQKLRKNPEDVGITEEELEVVTIEGTEYFTLEVLVVEPDRILVARDGFLHTFVRESEQMDPTVYAHFIEEEGSEDVERIRPGVNTDTTLLLGVRQLESGNVNVPEYSYVTILLHMPIDEGDIEVLAANDLYVPRSSGFWRVGVQRTEEDGILETVSAAPFVPGETEGTDGAITMQNPAGHGLTFLNGSYLSMESTYYQESLYSQYETYTFDSLAGRQPIDITLIAGEKGRETLVTDGEAQAQQLKNENGSRIVRPPAINEWGIARRNGRWIFRAIVRAMDGNTTLRKGFDLNILPTTKVFNHNELSIPWRTIKDRHPSAVDALTSPNLDYAIIQEPFYLYVYRIRNGTLDQTPAKIIRRGQHDRIVMGEWASGNAATDWLNTFQTTELLGISQ